MSILLALAVLSGPQTRLPLPCAGAPPRPFSVTAKELRTDEIHFESGAKQLTEIAKAILDEISLRMKQVPEAVATIVGYIDDVESVGPNQDLDRCRASEVRHYVVTRHGIDPLRLSIQGRGALDPKGDNTTAEGRLSNRRVLIRLTMPAVVPPAEREILFDSDRTGGSEIYALHPSGSGAVRRLTDTKVLSGASSFPTWSPDGRMIAFVLTTGQNADIAVMRADGSDFRHLTAHPAADLYPAWSPDGRHIAFVSERDGNRDIFVMDADGSAPRNVTRHAAFDSRPAWSPDGSWILFGSDRDQAGRPTPNLYLMRPDGSDVRRLTNHARADMVARFSPDGRTIAFASNRDGSQQIYLMNADGSSVRRLTSTPEANGGPAWSRDGGWIAFNSERDGNAEIYIMKPDGTGARRLTSVAASDVHPFW